MDYSKIRLNNERNEHVTKRLNRLNTWGFFKVLYRENIMRLFGFSLLMLLFMAPIFGAIVWGSIRNSQTYQMLPVLNGFGFSTGSWEGFGDFYAKQVYTNNLYTGLIAVGASLFCSLMFSGGFAVIRDAFWTGKLSTVGVFKSLGKGIKASVLYGLVTTVFTAFAVFGAYQFYVWAITVMPLWLSIILLVLMCLVIMFAVMYLMILCSVAVTYKQSVYENLDDAWRLMWLNIFPNIIHLLLALVPLALYFIFSSSQLMTFFLVFMLMFGGMYFPLVWQTHMMKTFALFHPVEVKKKKNQHLKAELPQANTYEQSAAEQERKGKRNKRSRKDDGVSVTEDQTVPQSSADDSFEDGDIYATDEIAEIADIEEVKNADIKDENALSVDGTELSAADESIKEVQSTDESKKGKK